MNLKRDRTISLEDARRQIQEKLQTLGVKQNISDDHQLYYDLKLCGLELYEFICWVSTTYEADFHAMDISKYAPGEGADLARSLMKWVGFRPYQPLSVSDILQAVRIGKWE